MQFQLCTVFFTFSLGTRTHYFGRTILHGGARVCHLPTLAYSDYVKIHFILFFCNYLLNSIKQLGGVLLFATSSLVKTTGCTLGVILLKGKLSSFPIFCGLCNDMKRSLIVVSYFCCRLEVVLLLIVFLAYGYNDGGAVGYILLSISSWFMALSWLFAPYLFNPSGFEWQK